MINRGKRRYFDIGQYCNSCDNLFGHYMFRKDVTKKFGISGTCRVCDACKRRNMTYSELVNYLELNEYTCPIIGDRVEITTLIMDGYVLDHSHVTNKFRGVLPERFNLAIGLFMDNPETIRRAASYLVDPPGVVQYGKIFTSGGCTACGKDIDMGRHRRRNEWCSRCGSLQRFHKISSYDFDQYALEYGSVCLICLRNPISVVDHDHACCQAELRVNCGKCLRGIICPTCNQGIGQALDCPEHLIRCAEYLESSY